MLWVFRLGTNLRNDFYLNMVPGRALDNLDPVAAHDQRPPAGPLHLAIDEPPHRNPPHRTGDPEANRGKRGINPGNKPKPIAIPGRRDPEPRPDRFAAGSNNA